MHVSFTVGCWCRFAGKGSRSFLRTHLRKGGENRSEKRHLAKWGFVEMEKTASCKVRTSVLHIDEPFFRTAL